MILEEQELEIEIIKNFFFKLNILFKLNLTQYFVLLLLNLWILMHEFYVFEEILKFFLNLQKKEIYFFKNLNKNLRCFFNFFVWIFDERIFSLIEQFNSSRRFWSSEHNWRKTFSKLYFKLFIFFKNNINKLFDYIYLKELMVDLQLTFFHFA